MGLPGHGARRVLDPGLPFPSTAACGRVLGLLIGGWLSGRKLEKVFLAKLDFFDGVNSSRA